MNSSGEKRVILGVTGSIAAYKAASILRGLSARGHRVQVVMTRSAAQLDRKSVV